MKRFFLFKSFLTVFSVLAYFTVTFAGASEPVKALVLPFKINAAKEYQYLEREIPGLISLELGNNNVASVKLSDDLKKQSGSKIDFNAMSPKEIRKIGVNAKADYVIWGSASLIGGRISIDSKMIESFTQTPPLVQFEKEKGIENLASAVKNTCLSFLRKIHKTEIVSMVSVRGGARIEEDAVLKKIKTREGDIFLAKNLSDDLKTVYGMGYFDDVRVDTEEGPGGKTVIFTVKEKPTVRRISVKGNRIYDKDEILAVISITTGSILNIHKIKENVQQIINLYVEKNYHNNKVTYKVNTVDTNQADIEFIIQEGEKVMVKEISFEGNSDFTADDLEDLMETKEKWFLSWLTSAGEFDSEVLSQDVSRLTGFYQNNGYIKARVADPVVKYEGDWIYITIKIDEGKQYTVGSVDFKGDLEFTKKEFFDIIKIDKVEFFDRQSLRADVLGLSDLYSDIGYANAIVDPKTSQDNEKLEVNIIFDISKAEPVYIERIVISGNTKTRDKVIRRQLDVYEAELYSNSKIKRGVRNLNRLDYFETVKVDSLKGTRKDQKILEIEVVEKPTGTFSFGGGYSSENSVFAMVSVEQRNLFGRGQVLNLSAEVGGTSSVYNLSFTEPWLFDVPISAGFDIYKWEKEYDSYDKESTGVALRASYPVFDFTRLYFTYSLNDSTYSDVVSGYEYYLPEGITSSLSTKLRYDSRDKVFNPTTGIDASISFEYAGGAIGGDIGYLKGIADAGWYIPLFWGTVGYIHGKGGSVSENDKGEVPDPEKFYLGGINSVRGYDWQDIHVINDQGLEVGGDTFVQFNLEFIFPLLQEYGIMGVAFYDMGDVYADGESIDVGDLYTSCGGGIRWQSPMGPLRIEYGYILNGHEYETGGGRWEFAMGASF